MEGGKKERNLKSKKFYFKNIGKILALETPFCHRSTGA